MPGTLLNVTTYALPHEAADAQFYGGRQPSGAVDGKGRVWFPSSKGAIHAVPGEAPNPEEPLPRLLLGQPVVDGRPLDTSTNNTGDNRRITLPAHASRLEFSFAPLMLRPQDEIRFRYRLEDFDKHWNYAGGNRTASYINLPAGKYRFAVEAFTAGNPAATSRAFLDLRKEPYLYQTRWFARMCMLLLGGIGWTVYHVRISSLRFRFNAVLAERSRLAREMHDTVIQGCTSVSALLEAVAGRATVREESPEEKLLDLARTQVRVTIHEAREAIWNLRHGDGPEHDLLLSLQTLAANTSREYNTAVECTSEGRSFHVRSFVARELLMTVREAVHNAVLHGRSKAVSVQAKFARKCICIRIIDNGIGFEQRTTAEDLGTHYGITGMRERVARLGGSLRLNSSPGYGTEVAITVNVSSGAARRFLRIGAEKTAE